MDFGKMYGTSQAVNVLRARIADGTINIVSVVTSSGYERLDTIAGAAYGDGRYWWVLATASDIGWGMQVPPGTIIKIPDLSALLAFVK